MENANKSKMLPVAVWIILLESALILTLCFLLHESKTFTFKYGIEKFLNALFPEFIGALWCGLVAYSVLWIIGNPLDSYFKKEPNNQEEINKLNNQEEINNLIIFIKEKITIHSEHKPYIPANIYKSTTKIDINFNKDLSLDLKKSTSYLFMGVSAKYVPVRIRYTDTIRLNNVKVIILDPKSDSALTLRAIDRQKNPKYQGRNLNTLKNEIRDEIYRCIVDLFDSRHKCTIEICLVEGTSVFRLEVFEEALYLSIYHSLDTSSNSFPTTFRYDKDSIFYNVFNIDSFRTIDYISSNKIIFKNGSTEKDLELVLSSYGMIDFTPQKLHDMRTQNSNFAKEFVSNSLIKKI